uniref:30S ribosomal protein S7 n=1 Tax=Heterorhabditis bacteriophora TaxID=37862 RepID=A0A1I7WEC4_HETBA
MMSKLYDRVRRRKEGGVDDITRRNFQRTVRHMLTVLTNYKLDYTATLYIYIS